MELLVIPSLLAIGLKIAIFLRYHESLRKENFNLGMFFLAAFFLNIVEFLSINAKFGEQTLLLILVSYYCCVVFVVHGYLSVCLQYSEFQWQTPKIKLALNSILALMIVFLIFNRSIIADVEPTSYSLTRIAGDMYWVFQVYALGGLGLALGFLFRGLTRASSNISRQQCLVVLLSTIVPVLMTFIVIGSMAAGIAINGAVIMSLALAVMLAMMVYAEEKTRLFRLLTFVPYTKERKLHRKIMAQVTSCIAINDDPAQQQSLNLKQMMKEFEGLVVEHVLDYYSGSQKKTASALGVSEATVSRRARAAARQQLDQNNSVRVTE